MSRTFKGAGAVGPRKIKTTTSKVAPTKGAPVKKAATKIQTGHNAPKAMATRSSSTKSVQHRKI